LRDGFDKEWRVEGQLEILPVVLGGSHVRLEPLTLHHLPGLCAVGLDESLWRLTVSQIRTPEDIRAYVDQALSEKARGLALPFATVDQKSGAVIGSTRFGNIDVANRRAEIGWTWLGGNWQRSVANTEAKLLMLGHGFDTWHCIRVEFKTDVLNERSRTALLRIGAKEEGIFRRHMVTESGRLRDSVYYSVIAEEWEEVRRRLRGMLGIED
jgi:Acetyltransferases, including N-acetylases of ribosomal proteins